jgi:hypothetical protein
MKEITASIIQKAKDQLNTTEDLPATELYDLLHKYRSSNHPDKFTDKDLKEKAEEKFKDLNVLLKELQSFVEKESLEKKPSELVVYQKDFELIKLKQELIALEETNKSLTINITSKEYEIEKLTKALNKVRNVELEEKTSDLITLYKPNSKSLFSLGVTVVLTLVAGVLTKIEEVANLINKYSPFEPTTFKYIVFAVLLFFILRYCKKSIEGSQIEYAAKRIKTPLMINKFVNYLDNKGIGDSFTEMNVYDFLSQEFIPKNYFSKLFFSKIFHLYSETTIDSMKDIFIYNLINRKLVTISSADRLDRKFRIAKSSYYMDYDLPF